MPKEESIKHKCGELQEILETLPELNHTTPNSKLPRNGIYFFYEEGEFTRHGNKKQKRIVRVGINDRNGNFRKRINSHYNGNKNSSVFRKHLGGALMKKANEKDSRLKQWLKKDTPTFQEIENKVSKVLNDKFSFKCVAVENENVRKILENQLVATLSKCPVRSGSEEWLGHYAENKKIRQSGLWNTHYISSNNLLTDESLRRIRDLTSNSPKALFIIPCCARKLSNGNFPRWNEIRSDNTKNKFQNLNGFKRQLIDFYSQLEKNEAHKFYKKYGSNKEKKIEKAWSKNKNLQKCPTRKAIDRYTGKLYSELSWDVRKQLQTGKIDNVLIISALMGVISPTDLIPDYELAMTDKSPRGSNVSDFWRKSLENDEVKSKFDDLFSKFEYIYCLMSRSTGYLTSIEGMLPKNSSFHIECPGAGQNSPRIWGRILNYVLSNNLSSPDEMKERAEADSCIVRKVSNENLTGFRKSGKKSFGGMKMGLVDKIREYVCENCIQPARERGMKQITIRAGDIHKRMGLSDRMPAVCSALRTKIDEKCNVKILGKEETPSGMGANVYVTYEIRPSKTADRPYVSETRNSTSNKDTLLNFLRDNPNCYCDDCLSQSLNITPRQQVNQICNTLHNREQINRVKGECYRCSGHKLVNSKLESGAVAKNIKEYPDADQTTVELKGTNIFGKIRELHKLMKESIISEEDFEKKKKELLDRL